MEWIKKHFHTEASIAEGHACIWNSCSPNNPVLVWLRLKDAQPSIAHFSSVEEAKEKFHIPYFMWKLDGSPNEDHDYMKGLRDGRVES